jgi:DNA-binding transcriptional LysR family regulator
VNLERSMRAARVPWTVAVEAEGWPLTIHFVALGVGVTVVSGCVTPSAGLVTVPITDLPEVTYYAAHRPTMLDDPRVADLLAAVRASASPR